MSDTVRLGLAWSGSSNMSATSAATRLLASDPSINLSIFTGVAGPADRTLCQWDLVLAHAEVQNDMDARPLFPRFTLPALNRTDCTAAGLVRLAQELCRRPMTRASLMARMAQQRPDCQRGPLHWRYCDSADLRDDLPDCGRVT